MSHPLDGCWAKLDRASEHFEALQVEIGEAVKGVKVVSKFHPDRSQAVLEVLEVPEFPLRWGAIVGDVIHNFRSALDYLAFELVGLDHGKYWEDSQFPIVDRPEGFSRPRFLGTMCRLTPEHRALIEWAQGYSRGYGIFAPPSGGELGVLRGLSNLDKHKLLLDTRLASGMETNARILGYGDVELTGWFHYLAGVPLEPGAELLRMDVRQTGPNPHVEMEYDFRPYVSLAIGGDVEQVLSRIAAYVMETIREFEPFFEAT